MSFLFVSFAIINVCLIINRSFTQHRYPTSEVPTFRFYFDNSPTPQFEIKPSEFGVKYPFIKPLSDKFVGPDDNGRGPIWVIRSFVPMEFRTHCKVTSDIKLEGAQKDKGEGGWGHITYHLYDTADGISTFTDKIDVFEIAEKYRLPIRLDFDKRIEKNNLKIGAYKTVKVFDFSSKATVTNIKFSLNFTPDILKDIWIKIEFDNNLCVNAPFGTFFGCEYGKTPAKIDTALLLSDLINGNFENGFPMPFFDNFGLYIQNKSQSEITVETAQACIDTRLNYNPTSVGYFCSSDYYKKTQNQMGKNTVIADVHGNGSMVYGVISGEDIQCGCEGDVRVFIDGVRSPIVESDGSESWGSYGWGFVVPPQCNPFSAYNGVPDINDTWSELRLTFTDNYTFRNNLRFELEHGCQNDGGGYHSGQIFYYGMKESALKETLEIFPESNYYISDGTMKTVKNRFENGIHENYETFTNVAEGSKTSFAFKIPADTVFLILKRICLQNTGKMEAEVYFNGRKITERNWFTPDSNEIYSFFEDSFIVPPEYVSGVSEACVEVIPKTANWNDCGYNISFFKR